MYHPRVSGTYYEMGYSYGAALRTRGFRLPRVSSADLDFGRRSEREVVRLFPKVLEEVRGFADACRLAYGSLVAFLLRIGTKPPTASCTAFAARAGSEVVFGRNYDFYYRFAKFSESSLTRPLEGYASVGNSDVFIGREDAVNEAGLAAAITFVGPTAVNPGVNFPIATRFVLDRCGTVREAVRALSRTRFSTTNNYLLADATGDMAVVEASPGKVHVREPDGETYLVCTNHFSSRDMVSMEDLRQRDSDSTLRYAAIERALRTRAGRLGMAGAQRILSDHRGYVCSHHDDVELGTLWSTVATLRRLRILRAEGRPCQTEYDPDHRLDRLHPRGKRNANG